MIAAIHDDTEQIGMDDEEKSVAVRSNTARKGPDAYG